MNDLWPDFDMTEQSETNNALKILREQSRALAKKMGNKVKNEQMICFQLLKKIILYEKI